MCTDYNDCTLDTCDPVVGCVHVPTNIGGPCATMSDPNSGCMLNSICTSSGYCLPTHVGDALSCPEPAHSCLQPTCDLVSGCVEVPRDDRCPTTDAPPCMRWKCSPSEAPNTAHGCLLVPREAGSYCKHERPCVMESCCDGEGGCFGTPVHAMCERDLLHCSVDTCIADLSDVEGVDELGCRQTLLEGECRHSDPCVVSEAPDFITTCNPETFECEGGHRMFCPHGGHSFAACFGGVCESESISVSDDEADNYFHFEDWWLLFFIMLILMCILLTFVLYLYADIRHRLSRDPDSPDYSAYNGFETEGSGMVDRFDTSSSTTASNARSLSGNGRYQAVKRVARVGKAGVVNVEPRASKTSQKQKKRRRRGRGKAEDPDYREFPGAYTRVPDDQSEKASKRSWRFWRR